MEVKDLVRKLLQEIDAIGKVETVVGEPLAVGDLKLIPISKLTIGFGAGAVNAEASTKGEAESGTGSHAGGVGGGIKVQPVAFVAVDPEGGAQLLCLDEPEANVVDKLINLAPDLVDKVMAQLKGRKDSGS